MPPQTLKANEHCLRRPSPLTSRRDRIIAAKEHDTFAPLGQCGAGRTQFGHGIRLQIRRAQQCTELPALRARDAGGILGRCLVR